MTNAASNTFRDATTHRLAKAQRFLPRSGTFGISLAAVAAASSLAANLHWRSRHANVALAILSPFVVHHEGVGVCSWYQPHTGLPDAVLAFVQCDRAPLPMREVAYQHHA
jgi:hypothetical protein